MLRVAQCLVICLAILSPACVEPDPNANANDNTSNDNGNTNTNTNTNANDNSSGVGMVRLQLTTDASSEVARALASNGTEYALFGAKTSSGQASSITQIDVLLNDNARTAVRLTLDDSARPLSILSEDDSILQFSYAADGASFTAVYVDALGETTRTEYDVTSSSDPIATSPDFASLCPYLQQFMNTTGAILANCSTVSSLLCAGTISVAIDAIDALCSQSVLIVSNTLPAGTGVGPTLTVPLGVSANVSSAELATGSNLSVRATAFGGLPPYSFAWSVEEGPDRPVILPTISGSISNASITLNVNGTYRVRVRVTDANIRISFFDINVEVRTDPGALALTTTVVQDDTNPFRVDLMSTVVGGLTPYTFAWRTFQVPQGATVTFGSAAAANSSATFSAGGTYLLELQVTDSQGSVIINRPTVTIIDPAISLLAEIVVPACTACTDPPPTTSFDTCVARGSAVDLEVLAVNATDCSPNDNSNSNENTNDNANTNANDNTNTNGNANTNANDNANANANSNANDNTATECFEPVYAWQIIEGTGSATLDDPTSATPRLTAVGPGLITLQAQVTDPNDGEVSIERTTIEVFECATGVTADILSDGVPQNELVCEAFATLNHPIFLRANVVGFAGLLQYDWTVTTGTGSFDNANAQNVMFTPSTLDPDTVVQVTVTDAATGAVATATEVVCVAAFSTTIEGPEADCGSDATPCMIANNSFRVFTAVPADDAPPMIDYTWSVVDTAAELTATNLTVSLFDATEETVRVLVQGDGRFTLLLRAEDANDADNVAVATIQVEAECVAADDPTVVGTASVAGAVPSSAVVADTGVGVDLLCLADTFVSRNVAWMRLDAVNATVSLTDPANSDSDNDGVSDAEDLCPDTPASDPADATGCGAVQIVDPADFLYISGFSMPTTPAADILDPLAFACTSTNPGPRCDDTSDTVRVYFDVDPGVSLVGATATQTVEVGDAVSIGCVQDDGSRVTRFDWRQVPTYTVDTTVDADGTLRFTAPDAATVLMFQCRGLVEGAAGNVLLQGPFTGSATITVTE